MRMTLAALGLSLMLAVTSPADADKVPKEYEPFLKPPYPPVSVFAVLMPEAEQCRIALLRNGASNFVVPEVSTAAISDVTYLMVETNVHLNTGNTVPLTFRFEDSSLWFLTATSERLDVPCDALSHMEVLAVGCRLQTFQLSVSQLRAGTYDTCAPGLPRRLDFFADMTEGAISPQTAD